MFVAIEKKRPYEENDYEDPPQRFQTPMKSNFEEEVKTLTPPTPRKNQIENQNQNQNQHQHQHLIENKNGMDEKFVLNFENYSSAIFAKTVIEANLTSKACNLLLKLKRDPKFIMDDVSFSNYSELTKAIEKTEPKVFFL